MEIKDILECLDYCKNGNCGSILLNCKECNELLDYIINLQEDSNSINKQIKIIEELMDENERLRRKI